MEKPGYIFQLSHQIGQASQLSVHGNFKEGASAEEMTAELDKVFAAIDMQDLKRMKIPTVEGEVRDQESRLAQLKQEMQKLSLRGQASKLGTAEKVQYEQHATNIDFLENTAIPRGKEILSELKKQAA
jgi:hypothetical protein